MVVFISHQKRDRISARRISEYLESVGIAVYFDEYDRDLQNALDRNDPKGVVSAIKKGIAGSTHMLCLISPNTLDSRWVPFEIGYGQEKIELYSLTLKGIRTSELPDYLKVVPIIRDIYDINRFIERAGKKYILF